MKKTLSVILAAMMLVAVLAGCGTKDDKGKVPDTNKVVTDDAAKTDATKDDADKKDATKEDATKEDATKTTDDATKNS